MARGGRGAPSPATGRRGDRVPLVLCNGAVLRGDWSGVEKSVCQLARALSVLPGRPFDFKVLLPPGAAEGLFPPGVVIRLPSWTRSRPGRILHEIFRMGPLARRLGAAAFVSPAYVAPPRLPCPSLLVLYDLHVYSHPSFCRRSNVLHYRWRMKRSVREADAVVVPTDHVRRILRSVFPEADGKAEVVPLGVGERYLDSPDDREIVRFREGRHLPDRYLLVVGDSSPRKNLPGVVEAWRLLKDEDPDLGLVVVGKGEGADGLPEGAMRLGYLPEEEMPLLYGGASALVYPSFDEGFGLPVAEAMACGCPVVTGPVPAREFAGDAAVYCDVRSPEAIARAIREVVPGPWGTAEGRSRRIVLGKEKAGALRWGRMASAISGILCRWVGR